VIYIREAHPSDGWVVQQNVARGISIVDPKNYDERSRTAGSACSLLRISIPCIVDDMNDSVNKAYAAWPDRLYVIDTTGKVAVVGAPGPRGFAPSIYLAQSWLQQYMLKR
jgi:hypothetical protein